MSQPIEGSVTVAVGEGAGGGATTLQPIEKKPETGTDPVESTKPADTLEFWKQKAREQEARAKANADKAKQFDAFTEQSKTDLQKAQDEAQRLTESVGKFRARAVTAEAKTLARDFANPEVAVKLLGGLDSYVDEDGEIDSEKIGSDLADLLAKEPYLARVPERGGMKPNPAQGRPSGSSAPTIDQQIADATAAGNHALAIGLKQRRSAQAKT